MIIENIPEAYSNHKNPLPDVFIYDLKMTSDFSKTKVKLNMHMFSFLQKGKKKVHLAEASVIIDNRQSILIRKGNYLWSEWLHPEDIYYCKLIFFSEEVLKKYLQKHSALSQKRIKPSAYFTFKNDEYLTSYLNSLSSLTQKGNTVSDQLLSVKFEELLLHLTQVYGKPFTDYLYALVSPENNYFKKIVENNIYTGLSLEEIAFLCNMSLSTFKRHFYKEYGVSPGKWLREKRLIRAKELLQEGKVKASDIYLELGYNNLSNFSSAFKSKFGINPSQI